MKVSKQNAEHYIWGDNCDGWHLIKSAELSVIHEKMPPKTVEEEHYHRNSRQFFFILSGEAVMKTENGLVNLSQNEGIEIMPGLPHQMRNDSDSSVEFLVYSVPPSHGDRFPVQ